MNYFNETQYIDWMDTLAEKDYVVIDDFIGAELYNEVSRFFEDKLIANDLEKAGIGAMGLHTINKQIRGDYVYWLEETELAEYFSMIQEMRDQIRRICFVSLSDFECHLAYYPKGTFYKKHVDQFKERNNRIISFVLYLNEDWKTGDGGELIIHQNGEQKVVEPIKNRLILFKSADVLHEVAITYEKRMSITGWMLNNPVGLGFLAK